MYTNDVFTDDNVGHWQVMPHPSKNGWTRILYSCKIKLFNWIPEFVIRFLTSKALTEVLPHILKYRICIYIAKQMCACGNRFLVATSVRCLLFLCGCSLRYLSFVYWLQRDMHCLSPQATSWVKKESEAEARRLASTTPVDNDMNGAAGSGTGLRLPKWLNIKGGRRTAGDGLDIESLQAQVDARMERVGKDVAEHRSRFGLFGRVRLPAGKFGRL